VGGIVGMVLTGVFASQTINGANTTGNGLIFGETKLFFLQVAAMVGVSIFVFVGTHILLRITNWITPLRVTEEEEEVGLDSSQHAEKL
jgi:Amt family ammonium transporter